MDPVLGSMIAMGVGGGLKILGGLFDDTRSKEAGLMRQQADLKLAALEETERRAEGSQSQALSSTKARLASTGFSSSSSSFGDYMAGMAAEFQKQNEFARKQGLASVDLMRKAADITDTDWLTKGLGLGASAAGTVGNIFGVMKG